MANPQVGDTRVVDLPGMNRLTLNGVSKINIGGVLTVRQTFTEIGRLKLGDRELVNCKWVNTEFVEPTP